MKFERRIMLLTLAGGAPAVAALLLILYFGDYSGKVQWTVAVLVLACWFGFASMLRERVVRPLQTLANLLAALREGDYSIRARGADFDDALGLAYAEVNALSQPLREQHVGALETAALLRTVMSEIDVAIFAFDDTERLLFVNRGGERLLAQPAERVVGRSAGTLGLAHCLSGESRRVIDATFPGSVGKWEVRRSNFRQGGVRHDLLVLTDLSRTLREEERQVWQRLVRVLSHEINNSLAPIKSIAGSLQRLLTREPAPPDRGADLESGLAIIAGRAEALNRFMSSYARLARLPSPELEPMKLAEWVERVAALENRLPVVVAGGPDVTILADGDQLDQLLINILGNAVDAALETGGGVQVRWGVADEYLELLVIDDGPGLADTANVFVPFFTTKPAGTGIGLVLSRQIAEAHGGSLSLDDRREAPGCVASIRLPLRGVLLPAQRGGGGRR